MSEAKHPDDHIDDAAAEPTWSDEIDGLSPDQASRIAWVLHGLVLRLEPALEALERMTTAEAAKMQAQARLLDAMASLLSSKAVLPAVTLVLLALAACLLGLAGLDMRPLMPWVTATAL